MIWEVTKKEIRSNIGSPKLVITYVVCAILILSAIFTGAVNYLSLKEEAAEQASGERDRLANIYNYQMDVLINGMNLYRQPDVLSTLVSGVEGDSARRGTVTHYVSPSFEVSKFNSTPILAVFGLLDLEFIVKLILSLFAILFTFDAISGEKEMGTLKLNFANEIKRSSFIIGKLIGNFVLLLLPFIIPLLFGLLAIQFHPDISLSGEAWIRLSLIALAFVIYLLVFYSLGMMVSALTKRSVVSFLVLLMLWVLFISISPRVSVLVAQNVRPVPPLDEVRKEYFAEMGSAQETFYQGIGEALRDLLNAYRTGTAGSDTQQDMVDRIQERHEEFARSMLEKGNQINHDQFLLQEQQNSLAITISRLTSPAAAMTFAIHRLARTGVYSSDQVFRDNVENEVSGFVAYNNEYVKEHPEIFQGGAAGSSADDLIDVAGQYPDTAQFRREPLETSLAAVLQDFALMVLLSIVFIAVAIVAFLRYDVR